MDDFKWTKVQNFDSAYDLKNANEIENIVYKYLPELVD